ncbi:retinol dehydrogenase 11-like [Pararge aegeria]|uniref:Jg26813 protein n=1 Tax=Pararge aegeria aegeria TaxID=348720 RepID=A0A8S4SG60_9NEOP|nr:retinol dehydrogenase 11-like [Pararge aegeria]XP_039765662.1 retinol dehydrogenase 11-like [Pararge aegeria]XP_039765663.1 retinol dehydrogenase 11-like [Pararge aegeria]XP_039765664.1 retinol dehydrogenase 11-like [Pararge aegeria]XP_039765666.1 retinol dehydrogenase 11-like [Pararge aegeria]CAH2262170.1 jg26813 [Pararge aegeria aegeria]
MDYLSSWCKSTRTLEGYTAVITGGNAGIGKETALDLFKRGARVILACRNLAKTEKAREDILKQTNDEHKGSLAIEKLDLSSLQSVRECASRILASESKINILINNAGIMMTPKATTEDGFEIHIGTNHFGHALFTLLLLPRILESATQIPARIVTVASLAHILSNFDFDDVNIEKTFYLPVKAYSRSKAANIMFSRAIHLKLREHNIQNVNTYSLHPGVVATELGRDLDKTVFYGTTWLVYNVIKWVIRSPRSGAQTTIYCAVDEACANESGLYYDNCGVSRKYWQCRSDVSALRLWDLTLEKLDMQDPFAAK